MDQIIKQFLAANPTYEKVEWDAEHKDLTVYLKGSKEPFTKNEFIKYTKTWYMLDELEEKLAGL